VEPNDFLEIITMIMLYMELKPFISSAQRETLGFVFNSGFVQIFSSFINNLILHYQYYSGYPPFSYAIGPKNNDFTDEYRLQYFVTCQIVIQLARRE